MAGGSGYSGPDVSINVDSEDLTPGPFNHTWFHFEDRDEYVGQDGTLHPYIFEHECDELVDKMESWIRDQRADFTWASGVVWPDELDGVVQDCDDEVVANLEWLLVILPYMDDVNDESLREIARNMQAERDAND